MKRRLRLELHYINKNGIEGHLSNRFKTKKVSKREINKEYARITGWIDFISMVEPKVGYQFRTQWIKIIRGSKKI
jgi:hypothetical protein